MSSRHAIVLLQETPWLGGNLTTTRQCSPTNVQGVNPAVLPGIATFQGWQTQGWQGRSAIHGTLNCWVRRRQTRSMTLDDVSLSTRWVTSPLALLINSDLYAALGSLREGCLQLASNRCLKIVNPMTPAMWRENKNMIVELWLLPILFLQSLGPLVCLRRNRHTIPSNMFESNPIFRQQNKAHFGRGSGRTDLNEQKHAPQKKKKTVQWCVKTRLKCCQVTSCSIFYGFLRCFCVFHLLVSCHFTFVLLKFWAKCPWHHSFAHVARGHSEMHLFKCWL